MNRYLKIALAAVLPASVAGCDSFLEGRNITTEPNRPTVATNDQILTSVQATQFITQTGSLARTACMFVQQCAGTDRQYQALGVYSYSENDFSTEYQGIYIGGGLIDLRRIQAKADSTGDQIYGGVARVWEALTIGTAADVWGDIPYSQAVAGFTDAESPFPTPALDQQLDVYAAIQTLLDQAIANLSSGVGDGPGAADLVYGGDPALWLQLAHTLKARYYMHTAEVNGAADYTAALGEALQGISDPAADFTSYHSDVSSEWNIWYQFVAIQRDSYIRPGAALVDLMLARADPRLEIYFIPGATGAFVGASPGAQLSDDFSNFNLDVFNAPSARQPIVTFAENQLIAAEAALALGDAGTAQAALDAVRASLALPSVPATLQSVMEEKYIALFQQIEAWNDYKRTCIPALTPAGGQPEIPGRLLYPFSERNANPNIPLPSDQASRNDNDPNPCPVP